MYPDFYLPYGQQKVTCSVRNVKALTGEIFFVPQNEQRLRFPGAFAFLPLSSAVATVFAAAVLAAGVACAVRVVVMIAARLGIIAERTVKQCLHCRVRAAAHAAVKPDAGLGERRLRAAADAAADDHVGVVRREKARQRAVAAAVTAPPSTS